MGQKLAEALEKDPELAARVERYEEKLEAKRERLENAAERAAKTADALREREAQIARCIPMGQPILVGHHSERRHRRDLKRMDQLTRKAIEAREVAATLERRAGNVGSGGISSDDPAAVLKLKEKLAKLEAKQEQMKTANAAIRKNAKLGKEAQIAALAKLGLPAQLLEPDFCGRIGFAQYELTNNNGNIKRVRDRIAHLEREAARPEAEPVVCEAAATSGNGFRAEENKEANRLQIFFDSKPSEEIRSFLKQNGFRWSPTQGAWQRQPGWAATETVKQLKAKLEVMQ